MDALATICLAVVVTLPVCWAGHGYGHGQVAYNTDLGTWVQFRNFLVPPFVAKGTNVTLHCDYAVRQHASLYSLKWYKGSSQFYQYIPSKPQNEEVFKVTGIQKVYTVPGSEGRRVVVPEVNLSATDVYRCEMVAEGPPFHTIQRSANMTVVVLPEHSPKITGSRRFYHLNDLVVLNCSAPFALPPVNLTWLINDRQVNVESVRVVDRLSHPLGLESHTTQLRLRVSEDHFLDQAMTIRCVAGLADLYADSAQVIIREPASRWFASNNLYHTSGIEKIHSPSVVCVGLALALVWQYV